MAHRAISPSQILRNKEPKQVRATVGRLCRAAVREALRQGASPEAAERVATLVVADMLIKAGRFEAARSLLEGTSAH